MATNLRRDKTVGWGEVTNPRNIGGTSNAGVPTVTPVYTSIIFYPVLNW